MRRAILVCVLLTIFLPAGFTWAQQPKKVFRIGYLSDSAPAREAARSEAMGLALRELGYIEGNNIVTEYRYAAGKVDRAPELASELVRLRVDHLDSGRPHSKPGSQKCDCDDSHCYDG